jgi:hypothetical protein
MRRHRRSPQPTSTRRGRSVRLGSLLLSAAGVVALAGFWVANEPHDRTGGPRFRTAEQPATALGPLVARP